jgi:hypothetical protein
MNTLEWIVIVVFVVWFVATFAYQFWSDAMYPWVCRFDWFHLLPVLTFFAGIPRLFRLSYRDRLRDGSVTEWRQISLAQRWSWLRVVWNPHLIEPQLVDKGLGPLVEGSEMNPPWTLEYLQSRYPHRLVSRAVLLQPREVATGARQFQITELAHRGDVAAKVVFASNWLYWDEANREEVR